MYLAIKINTDVEHRWNSMYDLINKAIDRKLVLNEYCAFNAQDLLMTEAHWKLCAHIRDLLQIFYTAALFFSEVYYPTSNGALNSLFEISLQFKRFRDHFLLKDIVKKLKKNLIDIRKMLQ